MNEYNSIFLTKEEATVPYNFYKEWMGGELYIHNTETKLADLLEGDSDQRLLPGEYSLYMWGPQGTSLWIRNSGTLQFHEYYDRDIYADPQDKYMNAFKNGYQERKFDTTIIRFDHE
jgi:hypothetical protein